MRRGFSTRRLVTFGEAVMTFRPIPMPSGSLPLAHPAMTALQAVGGAELNVVVAFARTTPKHDASFVTVLPRGALGYHGCCCQGGRCQH